MMVVDTIEGLAGEVTLLTRFIQALGGVIVIYLIFSIANFYLNRKKNKEIKSINRKLSEIKKLLSEGKN